ncbi:MAG: radical SAM protein [Dehalococcoidia bacterium]|nr:radical SAM protein [Dehalococcoidia bacterium]
MNNQSFSAEPARTFGPVPSRRFGRSLGINAIAPKTCTYSCVYCQLGTTDHLTIRRTPHCDPGELHADVKWTLEKLRKNGTPIDYLAFVPDGEPTLEAHLGDQVQLLSQFGIPVAVITNASLLHDPDVRRALMGADRVSVKVDAVRHDTWRRIDRPHGDLRLETVLDGVLQFAHEYKGELDTETMLVKDLNDSADDLLPLSAFLKWLQPHTAYLSVPIRPPAVHGVEIPAEDALVRAHQIFSAAVERVELLTGYEGTTFDSKGNTEDDLLAITSVHPMRSDQVAAFLQKSGAEPDLAEWMVGQGKLREVIYGEQRFFVRRLTLD